MFDSEISCAFDGLYEKMLNDRRILHEYAETGFELDKTYRYVYGRLEEMGLAPRKVGRCGIVAELTCSRGKCVLLRADMDALPIREESGVPFASDSGNMHACGHDMHTAMLLGMAEMICKIRNKIRGRILLVFQPAEETLEGARDMISCGLLDEYKPDYAVSLHTLVALPLENGTVVVGSAGVGAPSADFFRIDIKGESSHGSTPHLASDALMCGVDTVGHLRSLIPREIPVTAKAVMSIGSIRSGECANVIADRCVIEGTVRCVSEGYREHIKERFGKIIASVSSIYNTKAKLEFTSGCPTLINDKAVSELAYKSLCDAGMKCIYSGGDGDGYGGSEDFAYITQAVPSVMIGVMSGSTRDGYECPSHNSATVYDESSLRVGAEVYLRCALGILDAGADA